jgi:hypothetical protein
VPARTRRTCRTCRAPAVPSTARDPKPGGQPVAHSRRPSRPRTASAAPAACKGVRTRRKSSTAMRARIIQETAFSSRVTRPCIEGGDVLRSTRRRQAACRGPSFCSTDGTRKIHRGSISLLQLRRHSRSHALLCRSKARRQLDAACEVRVRLVIQQRRKAAMQVRATHVPALDLYLRPSALRLWEQTY